LGKSCRGSHAQQSSKDFFHRCLLGGWIFKQYQVERIYGIQNIHPEFLDSNGNIIPDEVLAVRFEEGFFEDEYYDEDFDED